MPEAAWATDRHACVSAQSPDAPETAEFRDSRGDFGWIHSYETGSTVDGPGMRVTVFMSGCLLRCLYCHNPDTWHLKDGTRVPFERAERALASYAAPLRAMGGGLTISGGEPLVQVHFTKRLFASAKRMGLHTALDTSGFLGERADDEYLRQVDLVILDIKSWDPETYRRAVGQEVGPTLAFAERLAAMNKPVWVALRAGARPHRRSGECRGHRPVRRADDQCRMGRGAAVPPDGRLQVEGAGARLQAVRHADALARAGGAGSRTVPRCGLPGEVGEGDGCDPIHSRSVAPAGALHRHRGRLRDRADLHRGRLLRRRRGAVHAACSSARSPRRPRRRAWSEPSASCSSCTASASSTARSFSRACGGRASSTSCSRPSP